jgi:hypothetical protein
MKIFKSIISKAKFKIHYIKQLKHDYLVTFNNYRISDVATRNNSVNSLTPFHDKRRTADSTDVCRLRCSGLYRGLPIAMYRDATIMDIR